MIRMKLLAPLDDRSGPARPLPPDRAAVLVDEALARCGHSVLRPGWWRPLVVAALVAFGGALALADRVPPTAVAPPVEPARSPVRALGPRVRAQPSIVGPSDERAQAKASLESAEDLLRRANRLRGAFSWDEAERVYRSVPRRFPGSQEVYPALVAAAGLRLEQLGDPAGALRLYRAALRARPTGPLTGEVQEGIESCARLGIE